MPADIFCVQIKAEKEDLSSVTVEELQEKTVKVIFYTIFIV